MPEYNPTKRADILIILAAAIYGKFSVDP